MGKSLRVEPAEPFSPGSISDKTLATRREVEKPLIVVPRAEADVLQGLLAGKSAERACVDAGLDLPPSQAVRHARVTLARYGPKLIEALEDHGVTLDSVAAGIAGLLVAEKPVVVDKTVEMFPDHGARGRAIETVLDILPGARAPKQTQTFTVTLEEVIHRIASEEDGD